LSGWEKKKINLKLNFFGERMHAAVRAPDEILSSSRSCLRLNVCFHTYGNVIRSQMTDEVGFFIILQIIYNVKFALMVHIVVEGIM
jgi:hypothetical protein